MSSKVTSDPRHTYQKTETELITGSSDGTRTTPKRDWCTRYERVKETNGRKRTGLEIENLTESKISILSRKEINRKETPTGVDEGTILMLFLLLYNCY